ncbi:MAG: hypothetical protein ACHQQQ_13515 [Bacteroidota bacterium]
MKSIVVILVCMVVLGRFGFAQQLNTLNGELRYQYQYQSNTSAGSTSTTSTQSPMLKLATTGSVLDPSFISFNIQTALNLSNSTSKALQYTLSSKSFAWDYYDVGLSILQNMPVTTYLRLDDGMTQSYSSTPQYDRGGYMLRKQQQNLRVTSRQIPSLPSVSLTIDRTHQWSLNAPSPVDQLGTSYSMNLTSGGKGGSFSVGGTMSESSERFTGFSTKYYTLMAHGMRSFTDQQSLNYDINYNRYAEITNINGMASYLNVADKQFHYTTTLNCHDNTGPTYQSLLSNLSQSIQYIQNENFRYNLGLSGNYGQSQSLTGDASSADNIGGNASFSIQHSSSIKAIGISNGLSFGYGLMKYLNRQQTFTSAFSNGISSFIGNYQLSANHSLSYGQLSDDARRNWVSNNFNLNISGETFYNFQMQVLADYQSDIYSGDLQGYGNHKGMQMQWSTTSPLLYYYIPFVIGASGGENWFFEGTVGRTFNWSVSFTSTQFFFRNLTLTYRLNRIFDPNYDRQSINHSLASQYQWRAIALEIRFDNYQLENNRNDFWFTLSRPF